MAEAQRYFQWRGGVMRKLIVASFVSLDGVIEAPMNWAAPFFDASSQSDAYDNLAEVDLFLMGRVSYESFYAVWPGITGDRYIERINALPKLVVSRTLVSASWNATVLRDDIGSALAALKGQPGGTIMKYGVTNLDRTLLEHGLVDEYRLGIVPVVVGHGKRLFEDVQPELVDLTLTDVKRTASGIIDLVYKPK